MGTDRTRQLSPEQLAIKLATSDAVQAAGGQEIVARETGYAQSRVSDWCSPNTTSFIPAHVIRVVEALGRGAPGHPHVSRALARAQGLCVSDPDPEPGPDRHVSQWLALMAGESADVLRELASGALAQGGFDRGQADRGRIDRDGAVAALAQLPLKVRRRIAGELDQLAEVIAGLNAELDSGADVAGARDDTS